MKCTNCSKENQRTGYVELWDGVCPECGNVVEEVDDNGK